MADAQLALTVDKRLEAVSPISFETLRELGLEWYDAGENKGYLANHFIRVLPAELKAMQQATHALYDLSIEAAQYVANRNKWVEAGIPPQAIDLVDYSLEHELDDHLIGRFDFSGGIEDVPIKMLEFNADACSLLPETALVQDTLWEHEKDQFKGKAPYNQVVQSLTQRLKRIRSNHPDKEPYLLLTTMGYEEDWLNTDIVANAAQEAGFEIYMTEMENVIFSPDEGFYVQKEDGEYHRYDFWYKFVPWDFIVEEEAELFDILNKIVRDGHGVVLNPAFTMLLQSKALMKYMYELAPDHPNLLATDFNDSHFVERFFIKKPVFGRMGENISFYGGSDEPEYETEGDYGEMDMVYQQLAPFNSDQRAYRYQPSTFWTGMPSALCFRRQDDLILDDDAEFVPHFLGK